MKKFIYLLIIISLTTCKAQKTSTMEQEIMIPQITKEFEVFDIDGAVDSPENDAMKQYKLSDAMKGVTSAGAPNKMNIQLKCIHTLPNDEILKVWAANKKNNGKLEAPILSGQLKVKANNKAHRRIAKIVFVNVVTKINANKKDGISDADKIIQETNLTPFLKQALIKPEIANETLNLFDKTKAEVQTLNTDYTLTDDDSKVFNKYSNTGRVNLATFLNQQFLRNPNFAKYRNHYKVFFLGEVGGRMDSNNNITKLGGHANAIRSKECVMYANPMPFFVAHELMHCMGLYHSFDNNSKHTFKIGQTENIMDYSHISSYAIPNGTLTQISTWQWQWEILKSRNENEP